MCVCTLLFCLLVCALLLLSAPFCFCLHPFVSVHSCLCPLLLFKPFCFCPRPYVSVCALFSVCTLFHFTYDDFSSRKGHIKSDFLSIHHVCLHTFILSSCLCPFASVRALLFLSALFGFYPCPFLCLHSFPFYL